MLARLLVRPLFVEAVSAHLDWLAEHRAEEHLEHFLAGLRWARDRIEQNPAHGAIVRQDARHVLRMCLFPRPLPYLVYYAHQRTNRVSRVYLVRLFGSGQRRPRIAMSRWPW